MLHIANGTWGSPATEKKRVRTKAIDRTQEKKAAAGLCGDLIYDDVDWTTC